MESLYHQTNRLVQDTQECFTQLEAVSSGTGSASSADTLERDIQGRIDTITSNCERLDMLLFKEPAPRRQNAKLRIDQLKYDNQHLQAGLRMYQHRQQQRHQEQCERDELLSRRFSHQEHAGTDSDTSILIDQALQHHMALENAHRGLDDMLSSGAGILDSLRGQRATMKGAHRRLLDAFNTLGLSTAALRLVERRAYHDRFVLVAGMLLTCAVMALVVLYIS